MDSTTLAIIALQFLKKKKEKRKIQNRCWWVHPVLARRMDQGQFIVTYNELRTNEDELFSYTRMTMSTSDELYSLLETNLTKQTTDMRVPIGTKERLCIALRYLATGCSFSELRVNFKVGASFMHARINKKILDRSCGNLQKKANFPHCLGPIDGKHIRIRKPSNTGSEYFNYKNYFSIVLMAVVDANYKFLVVDIGAYGKGSDSLVFQDGHFGQRLQRDELDLPQASIIDGYNMGPFFRMCF
ncbi:uncharacterized protein LOC100572068 [Acyrthosiphon pisum]|uniref:DDE Tnp4 domain-containing protein n=1 Tax=Acyrthosiphon pisum TaxID=7029 RepID=A0A8R2A8T4_ACYPI|nr:uncharacterized protein LOC100572068 [Acyrthosiphon pisum]|eukprot:XP_003242769.1 PREDICTED: uncharacterized protein LOC100572068 [Acyrthosiphon pisum]